MVTQEPDRIELWRNYEANHRLDALERRVEFLEQHLRDVCRILETRAAMAATNEPRDK